VKLSFFIASLVLLSVAFFNPIQALAVDNQASIAEAEARLRTVQAEQNIVLDDAAKGLVAQKCGGVQEQLRSIKGRSERQTKLRYETYKDIQQQLLALQLRISKQGVETDQLASVLTQNQEHILFFKTKADTYLKALDDTTNIDCAKNSELFMAGVNHVRQTRAALFTQAETEKNYAIDTMLPKFKAIQEKLDV
jgi:hypothetical protein